MFEEQSLRLADDLRLPVLTVSGEVPLLWLVLWTSATPRHDPKRTDLNAGQGDHYGGDVVEEGVGMSIFTRPDADAGELPERLTPTQRAILQSIAGDGGEIVATRSVVTEIGDRIEARSLDTLRMNLKRLERARLIEFAPGARPRKVWLTERAREAVARVDGANRTGL